MCGKCRALKGEPIFGAGWHDIASAPKDGSTIEIEVRWGPKPWRGLFRWDAGKVHDIDPSERIQGEDLGATGWSGVPDANSGIILGYAWRPFSGDPAKYEDPYADFNDFEYVILGKRPTAKLRAAEARFNPSWLSRLFTSAA